MIIGASGMNIPGYSDDVTLVADGYTTVEARVARRKELTANRILTSMGTSDTTENHGYAVTYSVYGDTGSKSILVTPVTYLELGNLTLTYTEQLNG